MNAIHVRSPHFDDWQLWRCQCGQELEQADRHNGVQFIPVWRKVGETNMIRTCPGCNCRLTLSHFR